ncbi:MAG: cysteine peptidase family C39 domain-containing protein [Prevotella sp.]|nr:cysteine peptidase family C39 domain-containing protein [Prevotella sp.]
MGRRFPLYLQHDSMKCGIACLQMVCDFHGRKISELRLSNLCFATAEGVSLLGISEAATELGFETIAGKMPVDKLSRSPLPCILHRNQNHFVVLYKVRHNRKFYVADPGKGLIKYSREEFSKHWVSTVSDRTLWERFWAR